MWLEAFSRQSTREAAALPSHHDHPSCSSQDLADLAPISVELRSDPTHIILLATPAFSINAFLAHRIQAKTPQVQLECFNHLAPAFTRRNAHHFVCHASGPAFYSKGTHLARSQSSACRFASTGGKQTPDKYTAIFKH